ncbi:hypothetical protein FA15DRAFT_656257 [Coprinopsis marcescibilis]|uniref:Uncharacterized protein n=1 Tax=Coprinopsis marcescibilis TaxID=230819 RepID=A0A5C3KU74_COPMA|nr:hypothetical protein FA15DRAFT_656257 [Coprinopsis marcescibilis]
MDEIRRRNPGLCETNYMVMPNLLLCALVHITPKKTENMYRDNDVVSLRPHWPKLWQRNRVFERECIQSLSEIRTFARAWEKRLLDEESNRIQQRLTGVRSRFLLLGYSQADVSSISTEDHTTKASGPPIITDEAWDTVRPKIEPTIIKAQKQRILSERRGKVESVYEDYKSSLAPSVTVLPSLPDIIQSTGTTTRNQLEQAVRTRIDAVFQAWQLQIHDSVDLFDLVGVVSSCGNERYEDHGPLAFDEDGFRIAKHLLSLVGLQPSTTTHEMMHQHNPQFLCVSCIGRENYPRKPVTVHLVYRTIYSWCDAIHHVLNSYPRLLQARRTTFRLVYEEAKAQAAISAEMNGKDWHPVWLCNYYNAYEDGKSQIKQMLVNHIRDRHPGSPVGPQVMFFDEEAWLPTKADRHGLM